MAKPEPRCQTCLRPEFVARPPTATKPDPLRHCPRALTEPLSIESQQVYIVACLVIGVVARDTQLERARELLARVGQTLDDAIDQLPAEVIDA